MTIPRAAPAGRAQGPGAGGERQDAPPRAQHQDPVPRPGPASGAPPARLTAPPFSWLGGDAWPTFLLSADKPG